ncbi:V-type H+-transporting ATPase 16kDa proteolipid subunit [Nematocida homosporus]|uniref:V-type H+-transporting ATPase 16kDa proteolipid subunit n=1 Tax=Nematocida homosporus TaxID=1912981 RepID=UPI00221EC3F8|nr:V-type H+-transporting ATPase 16kDa proteolipid subunit [Nematocida homosporus]KAI5187740.1 V-type H+-transporting ATPase 16kDa proteolipid subunit [Nematocida homosporus]
MVQETSGVDKEFILNMVYPVGTICLMVPALAGVSIGLGKASRGVCKAASVRNDIMLAIIPVGFIGVMILYAALIFFMGKRTEVPKDFQTCMAWFAGQVVTGFGLFWAATGLGDIVETATFTAAEQKKFLSSFFLLLVFGEFVGLFALIVGVLLTGSWKEKSS